MSADIAGKWIITHGYADVSASGNNLKAILQFASDADPHAYVDVQVGEDGKATADIEERGSSYSLRGQLYIGDETLSLILTDGSTVLGLAHGPHSKEPTLA